MSCTLFVGNLKWECTNEELFNLFSGGGYMPTEAKVIIGRNGRSRGCVVIEYIEYIIIFCFSPPNNK